MSSYEHLEGFEVDPGGFIPGFTDEADDLLAADEIDAAQAIEISPYLKADTINNRGIKLDAIPDTAPKATLPDWMS